MKNFRFLTSLAVGAAAIMAPIGLNSLAQVTDHHKLKFPELRAFAIPTPQRTVLPNGMVVLLLEDHELPLIEVTARIRTGSRFEPAGKVGLAALCGQVMRTGGTKSMTGDQIDEYLEARAANVDTGIGVDSGSAGLSCLKQDFADVLKVYSDILRNPAFAEDKLKIAKTQAASGISRRNDNPQGIMNREFSKLVYGAESPYARTSEYSTIESVTREDLAAFHAKYVHPERIILGVVGDFDPAEMSAKIKATFGDWAKGAEIKDPAATWQASMKPGVYYVQKEDMTQSDIIMGHLGIKRDNPDYYSVTVMNEVLGGGFGARLFSNVRSKKGLAYSVRGGVDSNFDYPGSFNTWMTTKTETTAAGIDALLAEINDIVAKPPTDDEVHKAKDAILNSFVFNYDSKSKILRQQITYEYFGFPADYLAQYRQNIEKVTTADTVKAASKYIHKDQLAILVVGPSKGTDRPLESFGTVSKIDIAIPDSKGASGTTVAASPESMKKGKALFAKVVDALGGANAVDGIKAIRTVSNGTIKGPGGDMNVKITQTLSLPDRMRQEVTTQMGSMVSVLNGSEGFISMPMGTRPLRESQRAELAKNVRRQAIVLAQHRDDPELKVQSLGEETVEGAKVETLLVSYKGDETRVTVDPATGRILKLGYRSMGQTGPGEVVASYSDFRPAAGLVLPYKSQTTMNGEPQQSSVTEEITINPPVDAAMFAKPEGSAAPSGGGSN